MDKEAQEYVKNLRESGAVINCAIVRAAAEGIVTVTYSSVMVAILISQRVGPKAF